MRTKYKSKRKGSKRKSRGLSSYDKPCRKKYIFIIFIFMMLIIYLYNIAPNSIEIKIAIDDLKKDEIKEIVREVLSEQQEQKDESEIVDQVEAKLDAEKEVIEEAVQEVKQEQQVTSRGGTTSRTDNTNSTSILTGYRVTSYYAGDECASGTKTGSGKSISDFSTMKVGNKTVYTYNGRIVTACATKELLNTGYSARGSQESQDKYYFKYYQEFTLTIDGIDYPAICLDSCGAAMWKGEYRIDIFVPGSSDVINRSNVTAHI